MTDDAGKIRIDKWWRAGATDSAAACGLGRGVAQEGRPSRSLQP